VRVEVVGVFEQQLALGSGKERVPLLVVRDVSERELHLPIGSCEGLAVHLVLEQQLVPRPLTHDLALRLLERLSAHLERVVIGGDSEGAAHATIYLQGTDGELAVAARPGDAVALALRAEAPIYATEGILAGLEQTGSDMS
jgi:bifunctional DNase/RNase